MIVNNKLFKIYNGDNTDSIIKRLAVNFNTIDFWLYIANMDAIEKDGNTEVVNILEDLEKNIENFNVFNDVILKYKDWINSKDNPSDAEKELAIMTIVYYVKNSEFENNYDKLILEIFFRDDGGSDYTWDFIELYIDKSEDILNNLKIEKQILKKSVTQKELELQNMEINITKVTDIESSDYNIESIVTSLQIETVKPLVMNHILNNISFDTVFNNGYKLLFCKFHNIYKVSEKSVDVLKEYDLDYIPNSLLIVLYIKKSEKKFLFKECVINSISDDIFRYNIDLDTYDNAIDLDELKTIISIDFKVLSTSNTKIKCSYYILNSNFHKELFLDEIMNNDNFSSFYFNERYKINKSINRLRLNFYTYKTGLISVSIQNENSDILVNINKISSEENIQYFKQTFSYLFKIYKSREKMLFNIYKKYIPNISLGENLYNNNNKKQIANSRHPLSEKEPSLFIPLYTRKCAKPPRILEDDEIPPSGYDVMEFPKYGEGNLKPRKYVCDQTGNFKFPGLRKNTLANNTVFKYLPCCYETNQEQRAGSSWNAYFRGSTKVDNDKYEHVLYKTSRILPNENKGVLPTGIEKIFNDSRVQRKGVFRGPNSFIDCISRIVHKEDDDVDNESSRKRTLIKIRNKLKYELCAQENSDIKNYKNWFENVNLYFEPRRFYRALEEYFEVNIYFFERSTDHVSNYINEIEELVFCKTTSINGILSLPNVPKTGVYVDSKRFKNNAYVYVHMGGAIDLLKYPHCEYIPVNMRNVKDPYLNVDKVYRQMLIFSKRNFYTDNSNIKYQMIDSTGRTYKLIDKKNNSIELNDPIQPLSVPIITEKLINDKEMDYLYEYVSLKRLSRILVQYCTIKYSTSNYKNVNEFLKNSCIVDTTYSYPSITPNYEIRYYDNIFQKNGKIIFESEDTKKRISYCLNLLIKRDGKEKYIKTPIITNYFENSLDYSKDDGALILSEKHFQILTNEDPPGKAMNNFLEEPSTNVVIFRNITHLDLNGYFKVFYSFQDILNNLKIGFNNTFDSYYIWTDCGYEVKYVPNEIGRIVVIYKINSITYFLGKISNI